MKIRKLIPTKNDTWIDLIEFPDGDLVIRGLRREAEVGIFSEQRIKLSPEAVMAMLLLIDEWVIREK